MTEHGVVNLAAMRAGMSRNTATKYLKTDRLPSELAGARSWRTRADPFDQDWDWIEEQLRDAPGLEAKTLFEELLRREPDRYQAGQLRTLQRRLKQWRAVEGPEKELHLPQEHRPGEAMQTDFTWMTTLEITIGGKLYEHMLCHCVLPYSNWSWGTPCGSESMAALRKGVAAACRQLGRRPQFHQTDNSTAATHSLRSKKRKFNEDYKSLMDQLGMEPRTIGVGKKEQNGDVEASNGALKRHVDQQLLLRGNRDFDDRDGYVAWLSNVLERRNHTRRDRLREELAVMAPLTGAPIKEFTEITVPVTGGGTISVSGCTYSVPSRLRGEKLRVRVYDERIEVFFGGQHQLSAERLRGKGRHRIDYRHVVYSLLRKPGGFRRYRYRDDLFPTEVFRQALGVLDRALVQRKADIEYLRILHLAATTMESAVEQGLRRQLEQRSLPCADKLRDLIEPAVPDVPELEVPVAELTVYDDLFTAPMEALT